MKTKLLGSGVFVLALCSGFMSMAQSNSLDLTFNPGSGANAFAESTLVQADGKILICGMFTQVNGVPRNYIARLNANGSVDTSFNASPSYWVRHMALQSDGKIVIGGFFTSVDGVSRNRVARLNSDGTLDSTFNPGTGCDGKIVPVDPTDPFVFAVKVQSDGKVVIGGNFTNYNGVARSGVARLNSNGSLDTSFNVGSGVNSWVRSILILPNGQILLSGWFTSYDNHPYNRMVRLNANGTADTTFNAFFGDKTAVYSMARQPDGKIIVGGHSVSNNTPFYPEVRRLNTDGSYDSTFNSGGSGADDKVETVLLQPDGKIIIVGYFNYYNGVRRRGIARLNSDGTLDSTFNAEADNWVWSAARQSDGKIIISGGFSTINGVSRNGVARLNAVGAFSAPPPASGSLSAWFLDGTNRVGSVSIRNGAGVPSSWRFAGAGDFNNDGKGDFIWQNTDGRLAVWFMNGTSFLGSGSLRTPAVGWQATGVGDLNNDGQSDILWRHTDGRLAVWLMNGTNRTSSVVLRDGQRVDTRWRMAALKDLDGDGKTDLVWQNAGGQTAVWLMDGTAFQRSILLRDGRPAGTGWTLVGVGDFNNDGKNDLLWQHSDSRIASWFMDGTQVTAAALLFNGQSHGQGWRIVGLNDFDSNGQNDLVWRYLP